MAVFTEVTKSQAARLLASYSIGELTSLTPVGQGIENSNYFLTTKAIDGTVHRWVLTLFETLSKVELPFFFNITQAFQSAGLLVPAPVLDDNKVALQFVASKPAAIFPCFRGDWLRSPDDHARQQVAAFIATMHDVKINFPEKRAQTRDFIWLTLQAEMVSGELSKEGSRLLSLVLACIEEQKQRLESLPKVIVHGDLFRDNVLFNDGRLSGVIDFYHACEDSRLFDLAVAVNDWCARESGELNWETANSMVAAYQQRLPFTAEEDNAWPLALLLAACRFWLSRLVSRHKKGYQSESLQGDVTKNPDEFQRKIVSINDQYGLF